MGTLSPYEKENARELLEEAIGNLDVFNKEHVEYMMALLEAI